jgi:hypothetical protein
MREVWVVLIPITAIAGLWLYLIVRSLARSRVRELEIRERIAMIERGHVPAPEVDPKGFERAMEVAQSIHERREKGPQDEYGSYGSRGSFRHRRAGTALIGVGLGLMVLIAFAGDDPQQAVGVGGFLVMLGLAFLVNGLLEQRHLDRSSASRVAPLEATPKSDDPR